MFLRNNAIIDKQLEHAYPSMKAFYCFVFIISCVYTRAQERLRTTHYVFNSYLLNPAVSGIDNYIDIKMGYRDQWKGIEGAPVTQYVSIHAPVGNDFVRSSINSFPGEGDNPMSRSYVNNYSWAEPHHGVGFYILNDKAGQINQTTINATYAYHIGLSNDVNLAFGISGGVSSISVDVEHVKVDDTSDPLLSADYNNRIRPDIGAGLWLYSAQYFLGISAKQLLGSRAVTDNGQQSILPYQKPVFYGTTGYKFFLADEIALIPSVLLTYWLNAPLAIDANFKFAFRDKVWVGGSFRNNDSYSVLAGLNIGYFLNLSYSYDITTSALRNISEVHMSWYWVSC
ncbi:type IX secretion system membrane protein PorP/SprF [Pedobacter sp. BS3]|uniref:PorP/SprF family type IX secretion system membrane protein n=1 Tax=Pedobacter sp. BS3 TaxID=2567937 RepID=UPI001F5BDD5D|nr:type IX secretion system membrane protein PorP/SprF [Pedobacter sp. BS3]